MALPFRSLTRDNGSMNSNDHQAEADTQIVVECVAQGKLIPPDVAKRVQERAEKARLELLKTHGIQSSGVQIIREIRGDLPNP